MATAATVRATRVKKEGRRTPSRGRSLPRVPSLGYLSEADLHDKPEEIEEDEWQVMSADCKDMMMDQPDSQEEIQEQIDELMHQLQVRYQDMVLAKGEAEA